ncbi:tetratricopeptide repeat protein [Tepidibacter hydrothermalis]|uniref:Tetratricopeptide repeat protein n=1 Tax=Tepidibacter hydrothermalis TaxID=3036126 RepID=A0ABY8E9N6_9FIRM|nr:tetratricopeptide repeat protein [Tepidibacter hydrothermalis]WFD09618.1 tetratricopeptide repeat protein [Tepidibacter hydrothermalis]
MTEEKVICCNCEEEEALKDYPTDLCKNCREAYIKYPVPMWIKALSVIVLIVVIFSLMHFKSSLIGAVNYERGLKAEKELKYVTAQNAYKKALDQFPKSELLKSRLFIASVKGDNLDESDKIYDEILEITYYDSDKDLFNEVQTAVDLYGKHFFITEEIEKIIGNETLSMSQVISTIENLTKSNKSENSCGAYYYLGTAYYANGEYEKAISAFNSAYSINPEIYFFKIPIATCYSDLDNYEKAKEVLKETFIFNKEYGPAYVSLSFINLKEHNYDEALKNAKEAYSINKNNLNAIEAIVISNHYLKNENERDKYIKILEENNYSDIDRVKDIVNGKIKDYE